jgi:uncharacterized protein YeaO (DUF488 family)
VEKRLPPGDKLRRWFGHDPERWEEFVRRYRVELEEAGKMEDLRKIGERAAERNVTLLFGAKDTEHNNARAPVAFGDPQPQARKNRAEDGFDRGAPGLCRRSAD